MNYKELIIEELGDIQRKGIDSLIEYLEDIKFFDKPASINHHSNYKGGLAEHSYRVFEKLKELDNKHQTKIPIDSIRIEALLHDEDKALNYTNEVQVTVTEGQESFLKSLYKDNQMLSQKYNIGQYVTGNQFMIDKDFASKLIGWYKDGKDVKPPEMESEWSYKEENMPIKHAVETIMDIGRFIELKDRELLAIRYHMGPYEKGLLEYNSHNYNQAEDMFPDVRLLQLADLMATSEEDFMQMD